MNPGSMNPLGTKRSLVVVAGVVSVIVAALSAAAMAGSVPWVDVVALFAGGFGAGATARALVEGRRRGRSGDATP